MRDVGDKGEQEARRFLCGKGFRWVASNFRTRWAELDLVMEDGATLVFIEVKKRQNFQYGLPEESITPWKMARIEQAAVAFMQEVGIYEKMVRFDVVVIDVNGLRHYPDAFSTSGDYYS